MTACLIDDVSKLRLEVDVADDPPEEMEVQWGTRTILWKKWKVAKNRVIYKPADVVK